MRKSSLVILTLVFVLLATSYTISNGENIKNHFTNENPGYRLKCEFLTCPLQATKCIVEKIIESRDLIYAKCYYNDVVIVENTIPYNITTSNDDRLRLQCESLRCPPESIACELEKDPVTDRIVFERCFGENKSIIGITFTYPKYQYEKFDG